MQAPHHFALPQDDAYLASGLHIYRYQLKNFYQDLVSSDLLCDGQILGIPFSHYQGRYAQKTEILAFLRKVAQGHAQEISREQFYYQPFLFPKLISTKPTPIGLIMLIDDGDGVTSVYKLAYLLADQDEIIMVTFPLGWEYDVFKLQATHQILFKEGPQYFGGNMYLSDAGCQQIIDSSHQEVQDSGNIFLALTREEGFIACKEGFLPREIASDLVFADQKIRTRYHEGKFEKEEKKLINFVATLLKKS